MTAPDPVVAPDDRVLVVVAHPDDETFGCGSLIAHAAGVGAPVTVLCMTRGEAGERIDDDPRDLAVVREEELHAAGSVLGVGEIVLLDYGDSGLDGPIGATTLCAAPIEEVAATVAATMVRVDATVVVVLEGDDGHRDHRHVRAATVRALADLRADVRPRAHAVAFANSVMRRWADEMARLHPESPYLGDVDALGSPDADLRGLDCTAHLAVREAAIAAHRSQRSPFDGLSPELRRDFLAITYVRPLEP